MALLLVLSSCDQTDTSPAPSIEDKIVKEVIADKAGIASAHPAATQIGLDILKSGGNAVDAAIAAGAFLN